MNCLSRYAALFTFRIAFAAPRSPLLFLALFCGCLAIPASALEPGELAFVNTERLNLRAGPSTSFDVIEQMSEGTQLVINRVEDGWARVSLEKNRSVSGWAGVKFLASRESHAQQAPSTPEAFFAALAERYGAESGGQGYLPELDTHYAYFCRSEVGVALWRAGAEGEPPKTWTNEAFCVADLGTIDVDGDGVSEIVYHTAGGGTGTFAVIEYHLSWPPEAEAPEPGYAFVALQNDTLWSEFDVELELFSASEMHYGQQCVPTPYCPFSEDEPCRMATACDVTEVREMRVSAPVFPAHLRDNPDWEAYIKEMNESKGFVLVGADIPESLTELQLQTLDSVDTGERPELSEERRKQVEAWLS